MNLMDNLYKHGSNLIKTGALLVLANLANQSMRESANTTATQIAQDIRAKRTELKDRREQQATQEGSL